MLSFTIQYAAAFWYNLKRSGKEDDRTLHAGCPVLLGNKWGQLNANKLQYIFRNYHRIQFMLLPSTL